MGRKAKKEAPPMEKPEVVKTHLRNMIVIPEMIGSIVGVYNGKTFNQVEIKPDGGSLSGRVLYLVQARQAWSPRYWCHSLLAFHSAQVDGVGRRGMWIMFFSIHCLAVLVTLSLLDNAFNNM